MQEQFAPACEKCEQADDDDGGSGTFIVEGRKLENACKQEKLIL